MAEFKDAWTMDDVKEEWTGMIADQFPALSATIFAAGMSSGRKMQAYLTYMAIRIVEMKRILKPTGSIYLHCDPSASHYLKAAMDAVFGSDNFRREIVWCNQNSSGFKSSAENWIRGHDTLLFYAYPGATFNKEYLELKPISVKRYDKVDDEGRRYKVFNDKNGNELRRAYLDKSKGAAVSSAWLDIPSFQSASTAKELTPFKTQKPLKLLRRVIRASSQPGDVVLDPFCGCATTCVAAELEDRAWIGIDLSPAAVNLIRQRFWPVKTNSKGKVEQEPPLIPDLSKSAIHERHDIPTRTSDLAPIPSNYNHIMYGMQEGRCLGCNWHMAFHQMTRDHVIPTSKGGPDTPDNLILLCSACNSKKGNRLTLEELRTQNKLEGKWSNH